MEVIEMKVADIVPYENNPRRNDGAVEALAASIKEFGFRVPIIVDKENVIVAGHTRLKAAERLGLEVVPVIRADDLTDEQIKAYRIADNKVGDLAGWDNERLKEELAELDDMFNMTDFGFGEFELSILKEDFEPDAYEEDLSQYDGNDEQFTANRKLIITYKEEDKDKLRRLLGIGEDQPLKVIYRIGELISE